MLKYKNIKSLIINNLNKIRRFNTDFYPKTNKNFFDINPDFYVD